MYITNRMFKKGGRACSSNGCKSCRSGCHCGSFSCCAYWAGSFNKKMENLTIFTLFYVSIRYRDFLEGAYIVQKMFIILAYLLFFIPLIFIVNFLFNIITLD